MKHFLILISFLIILFVTTCSHAPRPLSQAASYSEQFKIDKLNDLQRSILKITCSAYYQNYFYSYPASEVDTISQESLIYKENMTTNSVAGTGLIIYQDSRRQALLSCNHVFDFDDTLKTYYKDTQKRPTKFLSSLSIKMGQKILVYHKNGRSSQGTIVALDKYNDIALIETSSADIVLSEVSFQGSFGDAEKLKLGQEVHLLGFPKGFFIVTRGLASPTPFKNKFMVDAPFNRGFSGGVVIIFTTTKPYYQYVGMANSIAYNSEIVLTPSDDPQIIDQYQNLPYDGEIYIKDLKLINYGLTFVIKSNSVIDFLKRERVLLKQRGYDFSIYLN